MRKWMCLWVVLLLFNAPSVWAGQEYYVVKPGDCLSIIAQKYLGVSWQEIKRTNGLQSTVIHPGQRLLIPAFGKSEEIASASGKVWRVVGGNPYKGTAEWAVNQFNLPLEVRAQVVENIKQEKVRWNSHLFIRSGMRLRAVTFGRNLIWTDVWTSWDPTKLYAVKDYGVGEYHVVKVLKCGNWAWWKKEEKPVPVLPPLPEPAPPSKPVEPPPIFKTVAIEKFRDLHEHEVDFGGGKWWNGEGDADGWWWFAQYKLYLKNHPVNVLGAQTTPILGVFVRGDLGETDAGYDWRNVGIGPQVGLMWNGITDSGYPQQVQFMFRTLWEHMHGENSSSGYHKDEDHFLLGYYAEYLRRFSPDLMNVLYTEGWVDVDESFDSTWGGDSASDRTGFAVGYKLHKDWNETWASRFGIQLGLLPSDDQWGLNLNIEMRYNDWLIFGPSYDRILSSDIPGLAGGWSWGPFLRVELKHLVREKYMEYRTEQVKSADHELLKY